MKRIAHKGFVTSSVASVFVQYIHNHDDNDLRAVSKPCPCEIEVRLTEECRACVWA